MEVFDVLKNLPGGRSHLLNEKLSLWYLPGVAEGAAVRFLETIQSR